MHSSFSMFFSLPRHIPGPTVFVSHFPCFFIFLFIIQVLQRLFLIFHFFECFSPYFTSYSVCFLFCTFFIVSHQVLCPTMPVSLFPCLSVFRHDPGPTVCVSHFPRFSVFLAIIQVLQFVFLILHVFQFFRCIPCPTMCISHFAAVSVFLAIFQVIQCLCLFLHIFHFFRHTPGPTVCINPFSHFSVFLGTF